MEGPSCENKFSSVQHKLSMCGDISYPRIITEVLSLFQNSVKWCLAKESAANGVCLFLGTCIGEGLCNSVKADLAGCVVV